MYHDVHVANHDYFRQRLIYMYMYIYIYIHVLQTLYIQRTCAQPLQNIQLFAI